MDIQARTADVVAIGNGNASASVLDATGYVVARRMATVRPRSPARARRAHRGRPWSRKRGQIAGHRSTRSMPTPSARLAASQVNAAQSQIGSVQAQLKEAEANAARLARWSRAEADQPRPVRTGPWPRATPCAPSLRPTRNAMRRWRATACGSPTTGRQHRWRAPFAGVVIAKSAQPGEIVSLLSAGGGFTRTGIGTIVDMQSLEVEVEVGEAFIGRVKPGHAHRNHPQRLPGLEDPGQGDRDHPHRRPRQGHGQGARRPGRQGRSAHRARHGRAVGFLEDAKPAQAASWACSRRPPPPSSSAAAGTSPSWWSTARRCSARWPWAAPSARTAKCCKGLAGGDAVVLDPPEQLADGVRVQPRA